MNQSGLYFHIPFCKSKCPYCDFYSVKYDKVQSEEYIRLLIAEMKKYQGEFDTIYLGGGTPSILEPELICELIYQAKEHFCISDDAEITIECNPSKELERDFQLYAQAGINRISLGMQSARDEERFALGRSAGKTQVERAVYSAKSAGITNISLDVMLGTPKQTLASLDETFEFIEKMQVTHISAYMLKLEESTKFFELRDRLILPDEDTVCNMYLKTISSLRTLGFNQYEISNFAKPSYESRHNTKYWDLTEYLGIGKTAHSLWHGKRFYYDSDMNIVDDGIGGTDEERIMLGLRLTKGVEKSLIKKDYSALLASGLLRETGDRLALTERGMLLSNVIISELM